ncbi:hypothetical protein NMY22_g14502 [Coprinellus aureogranulatus]|nr:hypothetical protein NMY22_g14502 [Coprinellus aureogranulatus]
MGRSRGGMRRSVVVDYGDPGRMHGSKATTSVGCKCDEEVVEGVVGAVGSHEFVFGRLMSLADRLGWVTQRNNNPDANTPPEPPVPASQPEITSTLASLNAHLTRIHASLPPRTALIILTGHSDPRTMSELSAKKQTFDNGLRAGKRPEELAKEGVRWTAKDGRDLEEAVELTRRGLVFLGIKS